MAVIPTLTRELEAKDDETLNWRKPGSQNELSQPKSVNLPSRLCQKFLARSWVGVARACDPPPRRPEAIPLL